MKRGPKLNLIKKFGERGVGGYATTLTVSSLVSEGGGGGGEAGH